MRRVLLAIAILCLVPLSATAGPKPQAAATRVKKAKQKLAPRHKGKKKKAARQKAKKTPKVELAPPAPTETKQTIELQPGPVLIGEMPTKEMQSIQVVEGDDRKIAMSNAALATLLRSIDNEGFEEEKLNVVAVAVQTKWFDAEQAGRILDAFTFSEGKTRALDLLRSRLVDPNSRSQLLAHFGFGDDKDVAEQLVASVE